MTEVYKSYDGKLGTRFQFGVCPEVRQEGNARAAQSMAFLRSLAEGSSYHWQLQTSASSCASEVILPVR